MTQDSDLNHSLYEYFKYDPEATKNIQKDYIKFFKDCSKVLDLACGRGEFLELLSENGIHGVGIELDKKMSESLRIRGLDCICDDVFKYLKNSKDNSFDGIFTSHFIEHLETERVVELLKLCHRVLNPNGVLIITTPNVSSLPMQLDYFYRDFSHIKFYHPKIIEFFLHYAGFSLIESGANENFWFRSPVSTSPPLISTLSHNNPQIIVQSINQIHAERNEPVNSEYININNEFKKIKYKKTINPFIIIKRKIGNLLTDYILNPQINEINKIINNQIFYINTQGDIIKKLNIIIEKQAKIIESHSQIIETHSQIIENEERDIKEINSWVNSLYPPSEVYAVARKR